MFFSFNFLFELLLSKNRLAFVMSIPGIVDMVTIVPVFLALQADPASKSPTGFVRLYRVLMLARVRNRDITQCLLITASCTALSASRFKIRLARGQVCFSSEATTSSRENTRFFLGSTDLRAQEIVQLDSRMNSGDTSRCDVLAGYVVLCFRGAPPPFHRIPYVGLRNLSPSSRIKWSKVFCSFNHISPLYQLQNHSPLHGSIVGTVNVLFRFSLLLSRSISLILSLVVSLFLPRLTRPSSIHPSTHRSPIK